MQPPPHWLRVPLEPLPAGAAVSAGPGPAPLFLQGPPARPHAGPTTSVTRCAGTSHATAPSYLVPRHPGAGIMRLVGLLIGLSVGAWLHGCIDTHERVIHIARHVVLRQRISGALHCWPARLGPGAVFAAGGAKHPDALEHRVLDVPQWPVGTQECRECSSMHRCAGEERLEQGGELCLVQHAWVDASDAFHERGDGIHLRVCAVDDSGVYEWSTCRDAGWSWWSTRSSMSV